MERSEETAPVVCDAGPLIHLDQLDSLDLLADLGRALVPGAVCEEVERHRAEALSGEVLQIERVDVGAPAKAELTTLIQTFSLHAGEAEALTLMGSHEGSLFLTDDAAARLVASQLGYEVHGTIGILVRAIRRGLRTGEEVIALLREIPTRSTLFIRPQLLAEVIERVNASIG